MVHPATETKLRNLVSQCDELRALEIASCDLSDDVYLTYSEVLRIAGCSELAFWGRIKKGYFPQPKKHDFYRAKRLWSKADLDAWYDRNHPHNYKGPRWFCDYGLPDFRKVWKYSHDCENTFGFNGSYSLIRVVRIFFLINTDFYRHADDEIWTYDGFLDSAAVLLRGINDFLKLIPRENQFTFVLAWQRQHGEGCRRKMGGYLVNIDPVQYFFNMLSDAVIQKAAHFENLAQFFGCSDKDLNAFMQRCSAVTKWRLAHHVNEHRR